MSEPKYKLGDDGELEEIFDDLHEKPKRKRKPYNRTLYIPLSLMLLLLTVVVGLLFITYSLAKLLYQPSQSAYLPATSQPRPTETPGGVFDQLPPCGIFPVSQKPRFAFGVMTIGTDAELVRMDMDGTNGCRLTNNNYYDGSPAWSLDGKHIAFTSFFTAVGYEAEVGLFSMDANGENLFTLTKGFVHVESPSWSPDGRQIAFNGWLLGTHPGSHIFTINSDGTNRIQLTNVVLADNTSGDGGPNWSPDGKSILFVSDRDHQPEEAGVVSSSNNLEVYRMDANGENIRQLTSNNLMDTGATWSPDGQWIAFQQEDNIFIMDKEGKNSRRLTNRTNPYLQGSYMPFWTSDGAEVGFVVNRNHLQFVNIYSGKTRSMPLMSDIWSVAPWWPGKSS